MTKYDLEQVTTLETISSDVHCLAELDSGFSTPIVFVDDKGNQYEYDRVCVHNGMLKIYIKPIFNIRFK